MEKNILRIITLLNEKNHYLDKFYLLNEVELGNFAQGDFDNLEQFYNSREKILEILKYVDTQLEAAYSENGAILGDNIVAHEHIPADVRHLIQKSFAIKDEYVARIIEQDIQVLSCIEFRKNSIIKELQESKRNRKALSGYKVNTFENRMDEEV